MSDDACDNKDIGCHVGEEDDGANNRNLIGVLLGAVGFIPQRPCPDSPHACQGRKVSITGCFQSIQEWASSLQ